MVEKNCVPSIYSENEDGQIQVHLGQLRKAVKVGPHRAFMGLIPFSAPPVSNAACVNTFNDYKQREMDFVLADSIWGNGSSVELWEGRSKRALHAYENI